MYNAAYMAAMAIEKMGEVSTNALRDGLGELVFDKAPQGTVKMRSLDHQLVVPSYLMVVKKGWTGLSDMFEKVQSFESVEPLDARCDFPLS